MSSEDKINHPSHYTKGGIEVIQFIDSWNLGFALGNCIKYITRAEHKHDSPKDDLLKARWYLQHEIEKRGFESEKTSEIAALEAEIALLKKDREVLKMTVSELGNSLISAYSRNVYGR